MSPVLSKKWLLVSMLSIFFVGGTSKPIASPDILQTTTTEHHTLDWIRIESQGKIAQPPPPRAPHTSDPAKNISLAIPELHQPGAQLGPPGTVPLVRSSLTPDTAKKGLPAKKPPKENSKRQYQGDHWYSYSYNYVNNHGGSAALSAYKAYVANPADFSLLQTAVTVSSSC